MEKAVSAHLNVLFQLRAAKLNLRVFVEFIIHYYSPEGEAPLTSKQALQCIHDVLRSQVYHYRIHNEVLELMPLRRAFPPDRTLVMDAFHRYKDPLQALSVEALPSEVEVVGDDAVLLHRALGEHPSAVDKIGSGVQRIFVRRSIIGTEDVCCCYVERTDGSEVDFSLQRCFGARSWKDQGNHVEGNKVLRREDTS
jgi:hypothetical protein